MRNIGLVAGFPRSGSTLLMALLRQRNDANVAESSIVANVAKLVNHDMRNHEHVRSGIAAQQPDNLLQGLFSIGAGGARYYIDMNRLWSMPYFTNLATLMVGYKPPIVIQVRPLTEIVASFIVMARSNETNYIDQAMIDEDFYPYWRKPIDDARVDWLLKSDGLLQEAMMGLSAVMEDDRVYAVIRYADLVDDPIRELRNVERTFDMPPHDYDLTKIMTVPRNDTEVYGIPNMHHVRERIERIDPAPEKILSPYALARCELEDFWTCASP